MSENVKKFSCWDCQYFKAIDPLVSLSGYCRRYAPHSLDFFGFENAGGGTTLPLTSKGDLLTRNDTDLVRLPIGADGQILYADSSEPTGQKWDTPPAPGSSPLTTKGDLYGRDNSADIRIPVGTDGQLLSADSSESTGVKWVDGGSMNTFLAHFQAARFGEVQDTEFLLSRDGEPPGSGNVKSICNRFTSYDNGGSYPFQAPGTTASIVAIQVAVTSVAVNTGTVGANPALLIDFYEVPGNGDVLNGSASVPMDPTKVGTNNNTGTAAFQNIVYTLPTPIAVTDFGQFGWTLNLTGTGSNEKITKTRNLSATVYVAITPISEAAAPAIIAFNMVTGKVAEIPEAEQAAILAATSNSKWALLSDAPQMWCGEFKPSSNKIPPIPEVS